jgi:hypothetical protein
MSIVLLGSTSGSCTLQEQAVAGTTTLTLPTFNGTVGLLVSGTAVASTSGTSIDFTGIPAGVRRITVMFSGTSLSGTSQYLVQIGAGSVTSSGYSSAGSAFTNTSTATVLTSTAGFVIRNPANAATLLNCIMTIVNITGNTWVSSHSYGESGTGAIGTGGGNLALGGTLDRVRITTVNGTDTFDAGSINILYE